MASFIVSGTSFVTSQIAFVKNNIDNNFYWGRRGPSVHLGYLAPANVEWFYNEVTVPTGFDPVGSYFMANGFSGGYFGMQINSPTERRFLFSVWDADDGSATTLVRKGPNVTAQNFGGEGTGGQSYLVYNWKAGNTYRFLTQAKPDSNNNTLFSSWFYAPEDQSWHFIATWKRANANTTLMDLYSFVENFYPETGDKEREALFGNQWVYNSNNGWTEVALARFTGDAIASIRFRLDYAGGMLSNQFYLKNGGFFNNYTPLNTYVSRPYTGTPPTIDFSTLP